MKQICVCGMFFLLLSGCVQWGEQGGNLSNEVEPTVIFEPSGSSYLLNCINKLQGMKQRDFNLHYQEVSGRLQKGDDQNTLQLICLSVSSRADYKQFKRGEKLFQKYLNEHPDVNNDMHGLLVLIHRLDQARVNRWTAYRKLLDERESLLAQVESLKLAAQQDKAKIEELKSQIDQLKNIENIIKSREHQK